MAENAQLRTLPPRPLLGIGTPDGVSVRHQLAPFSEAVGDFFGSILGFEGAMAFMLEAGLLGIMLCGWGRVHPVIHYKIYNSVVFRGKVVGEAYGE